MASTLRPIYGRHNRPSRLTIERQNVPVPVRQRSARRVQNIAAAEASVKNVSLTRCYQALMASL